MKKIFLCCNAGMSTSMLVKKMKEAAAAENIDVELTALPLEKFNEGIEQYDLCLLGPQVRYKLDEFKKIAAQKNKKVEAINPMDYGMMKGDNVLKFALGLLA
ncbi:MULTISPECIES: PTS sugar transporter subunit IIB [Pectobacterium]|uniref:PTS sugar transporter subunit IIB n=1 Tax=Pectobacterium jejuense TaxID=2974022 RepID=A0ABW8GS19_9GAMM|nr:PTS sugar transporter subunit IIB [Pectobacterium carotovorum]MDX6915135.1 PTS sugar transporter subunit IIB [Pectobacterium carotovorum]WED68980.1 PTS sugar transporter subunit IIB [Pectobacterium colocasium]